MKKILLINTNNENIPYPVPPLGLCLLVSSVKDKYEVKLVDWAFDEKKDIAGLISSFNPDYIGLSIRNIDDMKFIGTKTYIDYVKDTFASPIKKITDVPLILGGSGFSIFPKQLMKILDADYGVVGEGENVFITLLDYLDNGKDPSLVPGVITKTHLDYVKNDNLNDISNMSFSEIDLKLNFEPYREKSVYSIQTKRGCYHKCVYCTYPVIEGTTYRTRTPKSIADEIEDASNRLGVLTFEFVDSTFNDPPGHAEDICREIIKKKLNIKLRTMGINPAHATKELFDLMMEAGFSQIDCTPDSASPTMIKNLRKNFTLDQLENTANIIKEFDIPTMWFFIFGGPGETEDTIRESFEFIDKYVNEYDMVHMTIGLRVYPDTELYNCSVKEGLIKDGDPLLEPFFYISNKLGEKKLIKLLKELSLDRPNCILGNESVPPQEMVDYANKIREKHKLTEPMFRTLLRLRYAIYEKSKV